MLKAFSEDSGEEVQPGDTITDFRGDEAVFVRATRPRLPGRTGRVVVRWKALKGVTGQPGSYYYDDGREKTHEYYDTVFDLEVKIVGEFNMGSNVPVPNTKPFMRLIKKGNK